MCGRTASAGLVSSAARRKPKTSSRSAEGAWRSVRALHTAGRKTPRCGARSGPVAKASSRATTKAPWRVLGDRLRTCGRSAATMRGRLERSRAFTSWAAPGPAAVTTSRRAVANTSARTLSSRSPKRARSAGHSRGKSSATQSALAAITADRSLVAARRTFHDMSSSSEYSPSPSSSSPSWSSSSSPSSMASGSSSSSSPSA
mmetsp:Transcript_9920/g.33651  ORF Transcript_9920/g.33651 Transcript_9920/m.33651 type:complete len:202 (-) Transcript_9920:756-1361(-)